MLRSQVEISVAEAGTGRVIGHAPVAIAQLDAHAPVSGTVPVCSAPGRALGRLDLLLCVCYFSDVVSSFELNEHLADVRTDLPLAPPAVGAARAKTAVAKADAAAGRQGTRLPRAPGARDPLKAIAPQNAGCVPLH